MLPSLYPAVTAYGMATVHGASPGHSAGTSAPSVELMPPEGLASVSQSGDMLLPTTLVLNRHIAV